jgi:segregation and condensation protein A
MLDGDAYEVKLKDLFEGPMDLLVHLIHKNEVDIYDIPIAQITDQYIAYLEWLKSINIDLVGDFLLMAATLIQIKSKMLLPLGNSEDEEDPRLEIVRPLEEYLRLKTVAEALEGRDLLGVDTFTRKTLKQEYVSVSEEEVIAVGLFELIDAFQTILENMSAEQKMEITADRISVKERINQLIDVLKVKRSLTFNELFEKAARRSELVVTFLAILEMVKLELIRVAQHVQSGIIRITYV